MASEQAEPDSAPHRVTGVVGDRPAHARSPWPRVGRWRLTAAVAGLAAVVGLAGFGTYALLHAPDQVTSTPESVRYITATPEVPLNDAEVLALLRQPPDYGRLADPVRRASCLSGLGYPATATVLGARQVDVDGEHGVLLVLSRDDDDDPDNDPDDSVAAVAVAPHCSAADTGLLAERLVRRHPASATAGAPSTGGNSSP
jgi:hypothetical protein